MAKRSGKCPKCSEHLEFDSDSGEPVVCPGCGTRLSVGKSHPPTDPPDQPDPLIGTTLGEFQITELLGRGAMGAVYKASQPSLDRMVAIKVLPRAHSEKFAVRFEREARAAAAVNHPNIINVYSVGSDRGYQYIAMELVDGETLADVLKREGPLPPERAIEMMKQTASAMVAAHGAGILHRDIKPANILLTPRGDVKVADFGLAKRPDVDFDFALMWEDMAYKTASLISPKHVRELMMPNYRKITDVLHKAGVDVIMLDSDGNVEELIPLWLEVGINYIYPMECAAGMDVVKLRKEYAHELIMGGGMDKRVLADGDRRATDAMIDEKRDLMCNGGYVPGCDHAIPPDIPWDAFRHYRERLAEIA